jgi:DNA-binding transcriptional LysR family regulator
MRAKVKELSDLSYGSISVGASCYTSYHILPGIVSSFSKLHPGIKIRLDMGNEADENVLYDKMERGELDVILKYDYDPLRHKATALLSERLGIAMPVSMVTEKLSPFAMSREELLSGSSGEKEFADPEIFSQIPFLQMGEHSHAMTALGSSLGTVKIAPYYISGARHTAMHYNLMREGLGAAYVSDVHVLMWAVSDDNVRYFMPAFGVSRTLYAIEKKNTPDNPIAKAFVDLAKDYCGNSGKIHLTEA